MKTRPHLEHVFDLHPRENHPLHPPERRLSFGERAWRGAKRAQWYLLGFVIFLCILRLILPFAVERYVNRQLNKAKDYGGHIGNVHLQLWRGRYRIDNLQIFKRSGEVHVPFFSADQLFLAIEWHELFHGSVVGQVEIKRPHLNFVSGPTAAQTQTGQDEGWDKMLESLFPFDINRLEIDDGQIHFQNEHSKPPVDISLNQLSVVATNLSNSRKLKGDLPAGVKAHSTTLGKGDMDVTVQLNPMAGAPTYQVVAQLTNVDLTALNGFLKAYGKFDVASGEFGLYTSVAAKEGTYDGYIKVFFNHLKVFSWEKDKQKNALEIFWEAIVGTLTTTFKNHPKDSLATRIPISGSYEKSKVGVLSAVGTLLRHAFIRALVPDVDQKVTVQQVEAKQGDKADPEQKSPLEPESRPEPSSRK